ncbi:MAG: hypothetical protein KDA24_16770 [Deltaproteobacteria bacterium]|nr:hypothetical protein [Deltaproteobacteria bacterium]
MSRATPDPSPFLARLPFRPGRLRALIPIVLAAGCMAVDVPGGVSLLAIGFGGAALVWIEDGLAPLESWRARYPALPWHRVERLPTGPDARTFVKVCEEIQGAVRDLETAHGAPGLQSKAIRGELSGLLALAADLGAQRGDLRTMPALVERRKRVEETLQTIIPAVQRLRATLQRAAVPGTSAHRPRLGSLLTMERDLAAHQDCLDEMEELPCLP